MTPSSLQRQRSEAAVNNCLLHAKKVEDCSQSVHKVFDFRWPCTVQDDAPFIMVHYDDVIMHCDDVTLYYGISLY